MAVAAHVSRVAKEYAPYGYSIMSDIGSVLEFDGTVPDSINLGLLPVDDADIFIESAQVFIAGRSALAAGDFTVSLKWADNGGSLLNPQELAGAGIDLSDPSTLVWTDMGIDKNQSVPSGKVLYIHVAKDASVTAAELALIRVNVRYRRKA